eukprot:g6093.t1
MASRSLGASSAVFDSLLGSKANFHSKVNRGAKSLFGQRVGGGGKRGAASSSSNGTLGGRSELRPASLDFFSAGFGGGGGGSSPKVAAGKHAAASSRAGATASSSTTTSGSKKRRRSGSKEGKDRTASKQQDDDDDDDDVEKQEEEESEEEEEDEESEEEESEEDVTVFGKRRAKAPVEDETRPNVAQHRAEEVLAFRRRMRIAVKGDRVPDPLETFDQMVFSAKGSDHVRRVLLRNIEASAYTEPSPVQMQAIPAMLQNRDVLACAPTGSGKTAAFLIPTIARLRAPSKHGTPGVRAVVLAPTRELATQIGREFDKLAHGKKFRTLVLSKASMGSLKGGRELDLLIATPMRLVHLLKEDGISLARTEIVVLDEADKLLEMGFIDQVDEVLAAVTHPEATKALFSATMPPAIEELAEITLRDRVTVTVGAKNAGATTVKQRLQFVGREQGKLLSVRQLVQDGLKPPVIIFVQSKDRAAALFKELIYDGINVDVIHAERTQSQRDEIVARFRRGEIWVLIATDLMARGMDFKGVNCVINYDFPQSVISYVHRIGRTGRAGRPGEAITLFTEDDMVLLRSIANVMRVSGCEVPDWMLKIKKLSSSRKKDLDKAPPKRADISTTSGWDKKKQTRKKQMVAATKKQKRGGKGAGRD